MRPISTTAIFAIAFGLGACSSESAPDDGSGAGSPNAGAGGAAAGSAGSAGAGGSAAGSTATGGGGAAAGSSGMSGAGSGRGGGAGTGAAGTVGGAAGSAGSSSGAASGGAGSGGAASGSGGDAGGGVTGGGGAGGTAGGGGAGGSGGSSGSVMPKAGMNFFVTSKGMPSGGNLGSLEAADAFCQSLAAAVSADLGAKTWRAYLSTSTGDARDRIGTGPWRNQAGAVIANNVADLHAQEPGEALDDTWPPTDLGIALDETGGELENSVHDILTGSNADGTVFEGNTCDDWTSDSEDDTAGVGHSNRDGGGRDPSFNATHTVGCAPSTSNYQSGTVSSGGGRGSFYCFALEPSPEA